MNKPTKISSEVNQMENEQNICFKKQEENKQESGQSQYQSSQTSSENQVKQRPVFQILDEQRLISMRVAKKQKQVNQQPDRKDQFQIEEEANEALHQDQRQAFLYLLSVRKQKKTLLQQKKKRKTQISAQITLKTIIDQKTFQLKDCPQNIPQLEKEQSLSQSRLLNEYTKCILQNFNILIQNIKYMIKSNDSYSQNNKKFNNKLYESIKLQNQPQVYGLIRLTIGQIQSAIRKLSFQLRFGPKTKKQINDNQGDQKGYSISQRTSLLANYLLWIYSLLALHQGWSSYKHFEALAQINLVLTLKIQELNKTNNQQKKSLLLLFILMANSFEQWHLKRHVHELFKNIN